MAVPTFKDELDDLPATATVATPAATPAAQAAAPAVSKPVVVEDEDDDKAALVGGKKAAAADEQEDLSVDFGDKTLMTRGDGLDRVRPEKGKAVRFAILGEFIKARMAYTHFIDKKGTYRCLADKIKRAKKEAGGDPNAEGYCCVKLKEASEPTIVALVLFYKNADPESGRYEKGAVLDWEVRYVQLTKANFQAISRLPEEDQTVNDIDVVMTHANRAFGYEFQKIASKARWKVNPELVAEVTEKAKPYLDGKKLDGKLGRKVTDLEMKALISSLSAGAEDAKLGDVESL
jgi:hypothetical protein